MFLKVQNVYCKPLAYHQYLPRHDCNAISKAITYVVSQLCNVTYVAACIKVSHVESELISKPTESR